MPVLLGVLLLASMLVEIIPVLISHGILGKGILQDTILANIIGSASTGQPILAAAIEA